MTCERISKATSYRGSSAFSLARNRGIRTRKVWRYSEEKKALIASTNSAAIVEVEEGSEMGGMPWLYRNDRSRISAWISSISNFELTAKINSLSASSTRRTTLSGKVTKPLSIIFFDAAEGLPNGSVTLPSCFFRESRYAFTCSGRIPSWWPERIKWS